MEKSTATVSGTSRTASLAPYWGLAALLLLMTAVILPAIFWATALTQQAGDMRDWHLPQVNIFVEHPFSFLSYQPDSATLPGHHIFLAWIGRLLGYRHIAPDNIPIRLVNAAFGYLAVIYAWRIFSRHCAGHSTPLIMAVPIAFSSYLLFASIWINTDNGAFLFYEAVIDLATNPGPLSLWALPICAALVMWRQIYLPVTGLFGISWLLYDRKATSLYRPALAVLIPCVILGIYDLHWGGLTPPRFQHFNGQAQQPALPLSAFSVMAIILPFYWGYLGATVRSFLRSRPAVALAIAAVVVLLWLLGPSDHNVAAGRWGGLVWSLTRLLPNIDDRSPLILVTALVGALTLGALIADSVRKPGPLLACIGFCLYLVGYCAQREAFQRYIEVQILFIYGFLSLGHQPPTAVMRYGPIVLGVAFAALSLARAYGILPRMFD